MTNPELQELIDRLKADGLKVYGPEKLTTYVYFTDGTRIGYAQVGRQGEQYATVHKTSANIGTGFAADSPEEALSFAPAWVREGLRRCVRKFASFAEFRSKHWQPLGGI